MKNKTSSTTRILTNLVLACVLLSSSAGAQNLFWDANGATAGTGGTGNWLTAGTWRDGSAVGTIVNWTDGGSATFPATSANTLNGNVVLTAITNTGGNGAQIIGSGGNTIDFGAGGFFVGGGNTLTMRSSALMKGNVTLIPTSGALNQAIALWIKADNMLLTNTTVIGNGALSAVLADHIGAFGTSTSSLLITNSAIVTLGALTTEPVGSVANNGSGGGLNMNAFTTTFGGGYIRSRAGSNTLNGPITLTGGAAGFITRGAAGVALALSSTALLELNANTLNLNIDSASSGMFINSVISGSGNLQTVGTAVVTLGANGTGTTRLSAANTFTGTATTTANLGTLALNNVNALQNATLDTGAATGSQQVTFVLAGNNTYNIGALTGSDPLAIGGNTISVGAKAVDTTFSAAISGAGGNLTKVGANTLTLDAANTYDGLTTISDGALALGASGAFAAAGNVSIVAGATLDVSAQATYAHGASAALIGSGTGTTVGTTAAEIKGGTTVDLGSRPVTANFTPVSFTGDTTHPSLYISTGALTINGGITVVNNGASPLGAGTYVLIKQASGVITGTPTLSGTVGGQGLAAGHSAVVQVTGGNVELVVQAALPTTTTLTRNVSTGSSTIYGDTLQFDVSVSSALATGTVELRDGGPLGTLIGSASLVGGAATITPADNAVTAGSHGNIVALYLGDVNYSGSTSAALSPAQTVAQKSLTVSGATAQNKYFDTTTAATVTGGSLVGVLTSDLANVTLTQSGLFATSGPGTGIAVTATCSLGGSAAGNYSLTQPTGLSADIFASAVWTGAAADTLWNTAGNWSPAGFPSGANVTADFNTLDITADQTVNLNSARTIGHLIFGDTDNSTAASWTLANNGGGGNILTLAGTAPSVTVNALGAGSKTTISAVVAGTSGLTKKGNGILTLSGANAYTGSTVVSNGIINFNSDSGFGTAPVAATPGNIVLDGGGIALTANNQTLSANRGVAVGVNGGSISNAIVNAGNLSVPGIITGPGALVLGATTNAGLLTSGANTYSGGATLNGPSSATIFTINSTVGSPGSLVSGPFGTGSVTFNGPGTRSTTGSDTTNGNAIIAAADIAFPTIASEKTLTWEGPVTLTGGNRILTVSIGATVAGKSLTINGGIGDGGNAYSLTKSGSGTLVLNASNSYSGGTIISGGVLTVSNQQAASSGALTIATGAARLVLADGLTFTNPITINGGGASFRGLIENSGTNNATVSGPAITINASPAGGGHFASAAGGSLTIASAINSSVPVSLRTGTGIFSGGGSYNDFTITGTGKLGANNGFATTATFDIGLSGAATFDTAGFNQTLVGIKRTVVNSATITNSASVSDSTLTLTGTSSYPGLIVDSGVAGNRIALVVNGGDLTLSGANTYSGGTTVTNGTLAANVSTATGTGAVAVQNAGTLTGNGTVLGALTVDAGGTFTPGISIALGETFTAGSTVSLAGNTVMQIGNNGSPASDQVIGVTDINYGGALVVTNSDSSPLSAGDVFNLFSASGTKTGNFSSVTVLPASLNLNGTFDPATGNLTLSSASVSPIPLDVTYGGGSLTFSWTNATFKLQSQTNTLGVGISTNWGDYPGGGTSPVNVPVDAAQGAVFFRLTTP